MLDKQGPEASISSCGASAQLKGPLQFYRGSDSDSSTTQKPINQLTCQHQYVTMIYFIAHANLYKHSLKEKDNKTFLISNI